MFDPVFPRFPADLRQGAGIVVSRLGRAFTVSLDPAVFYGRANFNTITSTPTPLQVPAGQQQLFWRSDLQRAQWWWNVGGQLSDILLAQKGDQGPQGTPGIQGPKGDQGAGVTIKGSVAAPSNLPTTGAVLGDTYIVTTTGSGYTTGDGYTYLGSGNDAGPGGNWHNVGQIRGPQGPQGAPGNPTTVNNKTGSSITLDAADVGALATAGGTVTGPLNLTGRLSGSFTTANDTPFFNYSSSEVGYTAGGGTNAFYIPEAWIHSSVNPVGHRELKHFELHTTGAAQGKFNVCATFISWGHPASGGGTSSGSLFGTNSVVLVDAGVSSSLEASAAEFNTVVKANITRKTGAQIVDASGSTGTGSAIDTALLLGKSDSTAVGYNNGIQFGAQGDTNQFPVKGTMILSDFGTCTYGIDIRRAIFSGGQALLLSTGHAITWNGGAGGGISSTTGTGAPQLVFNSGNLVTTKSDGASWLIQDITGTALRPASDAAISLGTANFRFGTVYASTGTINTSDGTLKKSLGAPDDALLDAIGDVELVLFQYLDAIAEKGADAARIHSGAIAQQVRDAMVAHGRDPARYSFWCSDPLTEEVEESYEADVPVMDTVEDTTQTIEFDGDGRAVLRDVVTQREVPRMENVPVVLPNGSPVMVTPREGGEPYPRMTARTVTEKKTLTRTVTKPVLDAEGKPVQRLGIRYDGLAMLLHAWTRRELKRLGATRAI